MSISGEPSRLWTITPSEWAALAPLLGAPPSDMGARNAAQACLYRLHHRHARAYRSFGWRDLPTALFDISGTRAHERFRQWTGSGAWFAFWDGLMHLRYGQVVPEPAIPASGDPVTSLLAEMKRAYRFFNARFLGGECPEDIVLSIDVLRGNRSAHGFTCSRAWRFGQQRFDHVTISARHLAAGPAEVLGTLLHEMVHVRNGQLGMDDTDPVTQYHTQDFRDIAHLLGLTTKKRHARLGYGLTSLGPRAHQAITELEPNTEVFSARFAPQLERSR